MTSAERHYLTCQNPDCERAYCVGRRDFERQTADIKHLEMVTEKLGPFFSQLVESGHEGALALKAEIEAFLDAIEKETA